MKKVIIASVFALASLAIVSCTKKDEKRIHIKWKGRFRNCNVAHRGTCSSLLELTNNDLTKVELQADEAVGTIATKKLENGNHLTTINLTRLSLTAELQEEMLVSKILLNDGESLIPADLMNASLKNAGLPTNLTQPVALPAGNMPLTLELPTNTPISNIGIQLTTGPKHEYIGHVTLLR